MHVRVSGGKYQHRNRMSIIDYLAVNACNDGTHDAFDVTVRRLQRADVNSKPARDRRANLIGVELLAFDFAALHRVLGESAENGLLSQPETERLQATRSAGASEGSAYLEEDRRTERRVSADRVAQRRGTESRRSITRASGRVSTSAEHLRPRSTAMS
jgi:hypothetical protein